MENEKYFRKVGKGPDVVFLHGWGQDKDQWGQVPAILSKDFTCWFLDLPYFGENKEHLSDKSPAGYAKWVNDFLDEKKIAKCFMVGHSFGGRIALICAAKNDRIKKLVLYSAPIFKEDKTITKVTSIASKIPFKPKFISKLFRSDDYNNTTEENRDIFLSAVNSNLEQYVKEVKLPTFIIGGEKDDQVSVNTVKKIHENIIGSQIYIVPMCGHFVHFEKPLIFVAKIKEFFQNG